MVALHRIHGRLDVMVLFAIPIENGIQKSQILLGFAGQVKIERAVLSNVLCT